MEAAALPGRPGLFGNSGIPGRKVVLPRKLWTNLSSSAWIALVCACLVLGQCPPDSVESLRTSVDHWLLMMETSSFLGSGCLTPTLALCSQETTVSKRLHFQTFEELFLHASKSFTSSGHKLFFNGCSSAKEMRNEQSFIQEIFTEHSLSITYGLTMGTWQ